MKKKLVIIAKPFNMEKEVRLELAKYFSIFEYDGKERPSSNKIVEFAHDADAIIAGGEEYNKNTLKKLKKIQIISRVGIGIDNIDLNYAKKRNIKISNTPNAPSQSTAEFAFSLIVMAIKKINLLQYYLKEEKKWKRIIHKEFKDVTVGIVGFGRIGSRLSKLLCKIGIGKVIINEIDNKKIKKNNKLVSFVSKNELFKKSDVITLHTPLTKKTKDLINHKTISKFKKGAILINASRGSVVKIKDLVRYIKLKKISTAMLDVMPTEPYFGSLHKYKEIVITPHNASMSETSRKNMILGSVNNLLEWVRKNKK